MQFPKFDFDFDHPTNRIQDWCGECENKSADICLKQFVDQKTSEIIRLWIVIACLCTVIVLVSFISIVAIVIINYKRKQDYHGSAPETMRLTIESRN